MSHVLFSDRDKKQIRDALPPNILKMRLPELRKFLETKNVDDANDLSLYPQVAKWFEDAKKRKPIPGTSVAESVKATSAKAETMLRSIPQTATTFEKNPFMATLMVYATAKAIHDNCYDADYDFDFSNEVQPSGIWINGGTEVELKRKLFSKHTDISDYQFVCKLTATSCATKYAELKKTNDDVTKLMTPLVYKKYKYSYLGKDNKGPKEGCFAMGPLRNMCDLIGFAFDEQKGECVFDEESCAMAGKSYDPDSKRCWTQNLDYLFGLIFTDSALLGAKAIEYRIMQACMKTGAPKLVCLMSGARVIGLATGLTGAFLLSLTAFPDAMFDPDNGAKALKKSYDEWAPNAGMPTSEQLSDPKQFIKYGFTAPALMGAVLTNPMGIFKLVTSSLPFVLGGITMGLGVGVGKMLQGLGVSDSEMKQHAKNTKHLNQGLSDFFTGKLFDF